MNVNDWIAVYYDDDKNIVETEELFDMSIEEAEELAEENQPEEASSYEVMLLEDYENSEESEGEDDFVDDYDEDESEEDDLDFDD